MKKNFRITIEYDGSDYFGWQKQKSQRTIQGELEKALGVILNQKITISGSGRTDTGVHAFGQVANFTAYTSFLPQKLQRSFNRYVKQPIVIKDCWIVNNDFHSQFNAVSKTYHYYVLNQYDPVAVNRQYLWHIRNPLDGHRMNECCRELIGVFDFKSFENTGSPRSSTVREVFSAAVAPMKGNRLVFQICASGFLKYMVRNLMGTLVMAGHRKITREDFIEILQAKDRTKAGPTAPPNGLFLHHVNYGQDTFNRFSV